MVEEKLKTLKDLEEEVEDDTKPFRGYFLDILREEAIKHIKELRNKDAPDDIEVWIKHFFIISEEDLR